jgi:hypothetical protein
MLLLLDHNAFGVFEIFGMEGMQIRVNGMYLPNGS